MRMTVTQVARSSLLVSALVVTAGPRVLWNSAPGAESRPSGFSREELLRRFDADRDGDLDERERAKLRRSFGDIDVPMLPSTPHRYVERETASGTPLDDELRRTDNTPDDNPTTDAGAALGRVLFYDTQLSRNNTVSCGSCHHQEHAFADPRRFSVGFQGGRTGRNAMGLANLRFTNVRGLRPGFFWDERAPTLEAQVLMPIQDPLEMGMELPDLIERLQDLPYYPALFNAAFGSPRVSSRRISRALAQFVRSLVSFRSRFDRHAAESVDVAAAFKGFTAQENAGKSLFINGVGGIAEIGCAFCHVPPTFAMPKAFNNGLDLKYADRGLGTLDRPSNDPFTPSNDGKFKAPSLRNIELTAPYMHDGRFRTLEEVVDHYSEGVHRHENLALAFDRDTPAGKTSGFQLDREQKAALVAFLKTLTDEEFVADPRFSDPFVRATAKTTPR